MNDGSQSLRYVQVWIRIKQTKLQETPRNKSCCGVNIGALEEFAWDPATLQQLHVITD
jgi:hypothetical protein